MRKIVAVVLALLAFVLLASPAGAGPATHFAGDYTGEELFGFSDRCPFLDHVYDYVLTSDRGRGGTAHEAACSTITDGNLFSAAGTFTIRLPGGTFSGTYTSVTRLPATLPGTLPHQITGGTGRFRGATGTCVFTIESLVPLEFGHQLHAGTWSCDVQRAPSGGALRGQATN